MNCDEIMEIMTRYTVNKLFGTETDTPDETVMRHLSSCASCMNQMNVLLKILTGENRRLSKSLSCEEVAERIPEMAETRKELVPGHFPVQWLHLETCGHCREIYKTTRSCLTEENEQAFETLRRTVLRQKDSHRRMVWEIMSPYARKLTRELDILVTQGKEALRLVPEWLANATLAPVAAGTHRSADKSCDIRQIVRVADEERGRQIVVETCPDLRQGIFLSIKLVDIQTQEPVGGVSIALLDDHGRYLYRLVTPESSDRKGLAEFSNCAPGGYRAKIMESRHTWEVPLRLS